MAIEKIKVILNKVFDLLRLSGVDDLESLTYEDGYIFYEYTEGGGCFPVWSSTTEIDLIQSIFDKVA